MQICVHTLVVDLGGGGRGARLDPAEIQPKSLELLSILIGTGPEVSHYTGLSVLKPGNS